LFLVTGGDDKTGPPEVSQRLAAAHGSATVEIVPDIGHWTALEAVQPVTDHLVKFLSTTT
jgi:pimeloyl-ACP methyl ester carboxylesterase